MNSTAITSDISFSIIMTVCGADDCLPSNVPADTAREGPELVLQSPQELDLVDLRGVLNDHLSIVMIEAAYL